MTRPLCQHVLRVESRVAVRCMAAATPGSAYCSVHAAQGRAGEPAVRSQRMRDLNLDVLPWSKADRDVFALTTTRPEVQKAAERAIRASRSRR